jgi:hypothetical protein
MQSVMTAGEVRGKPRKSLAGDVAFGGEGLAADMDTGEALARLEAAVERLAIAASRPRAPLAPGEGVPRAQVQAIADRLDETIARLRATLGEEEA